MIYSSKTADQQGVLMNFVRIFYHLAISLWIGGAALFTLLLTPIIFKTQTRDLAGQIVGVLFPGYFRWGLVCGISALLCRVLLKERGLLVAGLICSMLALTAFQAWYLEPRVAGLKRQIVSFETTPKDHPLRREFGRLHGISAGCNLAVISGGIVLIALF
jgi:hypothetical protein